MGLKEELFKEVSEFVFSGMNFTEKNAKAVIFGVPFDGTVCYKPGARFGPNALREASMHLETYSANAGREFFDNCKTFDIGNIDCMHKNSEEVSEKVQIVVSRIIEAGKIPVMLGGEHSIAYAAIKAISEKEKNFLILHFDAHSDLKSHEEKLHHGNFLPKLIAEKAIRPENIVQIGQREFFKESESIAKKNKIKQFPARELKENFEKAKKQIQAITKGKKCYITFDLDVLDPSLVPAVGTPEPGGLSFWQAIELLESIKGKVIGLDLAETASDAQMLTQTTAARMLYEMLAILNF